MNATESRQLIQPSVINESGKCFFQLLKYSWYVVHVHYLDEVANQSSNQQDPNSIKVEIDNIDMTVKSRFMRMDSHRNQSLHYVNAYAVQSRINFTHLPDTHPDTCSNKPAQNALLLLPSKDDDQSLRSLFATRVSRIAYTHIKFFQMCFDGVVDWHKKHKYYKEMSTKSNVVSFI